MRSAIRFLPFVLMAAAGAEASSGGTADGKPVKGEVVPVTMQDGRIVEFVGKRKMLKETFPNGVQNDGKVQVRFDFRNAETRLFTVPDAMLPQYGAHGAAQKHGDVTAGLEEVEDMVLAVDESIDRAYNGLWSVVRESGSMAGTSILLRALAEAYPKRTTEQLKVFLGGKTHAEKLALRNDDRLRPIITRLEVEKAAKNGKVDAAQLFAGLEDDPATSGASEGSATTSASQDTAWVNSEGVVVAGPGAAKAPDFYGDADAGKAADSAQAAGGKGKKGGAAKSTEVNPG